MSPSVPGLSVLASFLTRAPPGHLLWKWYHTRSHAREQRMAKLMSGKLPREDRSLVGSEDLMDLTVRMCTDLGQQ